jgi:hypothetical protein
VRIQPPRSEERLPRFDTPNILWFFGAIATASTSNAVVATVHSSDRGVWIFLVALVFMAIYAALAMLLRLSRWWVPGGLVAAVVVSLVPALGVGFEHLIGVLSQQVVLSSFNPFQNFHGSIFSLGLATMVAGLVAFALVRFDFVLATVALATLATTQFFLPAVVTRPNADDHAATVIATGAVLVMIGLLLDTRGKRRAAFWWHVLGLGGVAAGLVYYVGSQHDAAAWAAMLATAIVVLGFAAPLGRATWGVYGTAGAYSPLVHYVASGAGAWRLPLILVFINLAILFLGIFLHLYRRRLAGTAAAQVLIREILTATR